MNVRNAVVANRVRVRGDCMGDSVPGGGNVSDRSDISAATDRRLDRVKSVIGVYALIGA
jgi:hypothetical protein